MAPNWAAAKALRIRSAPITCTSWSMLCLSSPASGGQPFLRRLQLVEREDAKLSGRHPAEQRGGALQPLFVADDRRLLPGREMAEPEPDVGLQLLPEGSGLEPVEAGTDLVEQADPLAAIDRVAEWRDRDVGVVAAAELAGGDEAHRPLRHVGDRLDHRS